MTHSHYSFTPRWQHLIFGYLVFIAGAADARTLVEVEYKTDHGCKVIKYEGIATKPDAKWQTIKWDGRCKNGYAEGPGYVTAKRNDVFLKVSGTFARGKIDGDGSYDMTKSNGDREIYQGSFVKSLPSGKGKLSILKSGSDAIEYQGQFEAGLPHGKGVLRAGKRQYEGDFFEGKPSGIGKIFYPNNATYEGEIREGKENGNGKLTLPNGTTVTGYFTNGQMPASGRINSAKGIVYEGEMVKLRPHGKGRMTMLDKSSYVGDFRDGKPEGEGIAEMADGRRIDVIASSGKIRPKEQPQTTRTIAESTSGNAAEKDDEEMGLLDWLLVLGAAVDKASREREDELIRQRALAPPPSPSSYRCRKVYKDTTQCDPW